MTGRTAGACASQWPGARPPDRAGQSACHSKRLCTVRGRPSARLGPAPERGRDRARPGWPWTGFGARPGPVHRGATRVRHGEPRRGRRSVRAPDHLPPPRRRRSNPSPAAALGRSRVRPRAHRRRTGSFRARYSPAMRKLLALCLAFLLQTTAALSAPLESCCLDDCSEAVCAMASCSACLQASALPCEPTLLRRDTAGATDTSNAAAPRNPAPAIWRPPE